MIFIKKIIFIKDSLYFLTLYIVIYSSNKCFNLVVFNKAFILQHLEILNHLTTYLENISFLNGPLCVSFYSLLILVNLLYDEENSY